ncbi:hypothetical protein A9P82_05685 [Arachidicoccus ginsenosidimutans]|uniref:hypothetical protein n=1 Tax=Arachidicoccus sp. BS20 TaxID=1850526 RepID=UPI0007F0CFD2|nr:hypothetical protein [Arachidicoccus sp. BS20]ANI88823.1 hypothetical protein A9P82_05685 [Arachidicoccus sp. BS20]
MELIINIDDIKESSKSEWLLRTLNLLGIHYKTQETPQNLEEYNNDLLEGDNEIEQGHFITAEDLKKESLQW